MMRTKIRNPNEWLSGDDIAVIGHTINDDSKIKFIPTINPYLPSNQEGSLEKLLLENTETLAQNADGAGCTAGAGTGADTTSSSISKKPVIAMINISPDQFSVEGNHWIMLLSFMETDEKQKVFLINPMDSSLYGPAINDLKKRINMIYSNEDTTQIKHLNVQRDSSNCGVWVLYFMEKIKSADLPFSRDSVESVLHGIKNNTNLNIATVRENFAGVYEASISSQTVSVRIGVQGSGSGCSVTARL